MRCVAGAGLLVLVGCNQVFGLHKTDLFDAPSPEAGNRPYFVKLTWQVADVLPSGDPDPILLDAPITPAPAVSYGLLGQPLKNTSYSSSDGSVQVEQSLFEHDRNGKLATWRLEYTLAGGVPHEVQWAPEDMVGQIAVPLFGRVARLAAPTGGGYTFTPTLFDPLTESYQSPRIFTTGQWSEGKVPQTGADGSIDYDFADAAAMSGGRARPDPARGDRAILVDYATDGAGCRVARGSAVLDSAAIVPNQHSHPQATWDKQLTDVTSSMVDVADIARVLNRVGPIDAGTLALGFAAHAAMPGLTGVQPSPRLTPTTVLPAPVMLTLLECPFSAPALPQTHQPPAFGGFTRLLHVQLVSRREVLGVTLNAGIETAITSPTVTDLKITFPATIPNTVTLTTSAGKLVLDANDDVDLGPASGMFTLDFVPEDGLRADYYDVTVHQIAESALVAKRVYTVTVPQVVIDGATLTPGAVYVFEIRSFKGHPDAGTGDFRPVSYPYGSAIVFTRTFHTS